MFLGPIPIPNVMICSLKYFSSFWLLSVSGQPGSAVLTYPMLIDLCAAAVARRMAGRALLADPVPQSSSSTETIARPS